jgi:hypothetical protein
MGLPPASLPNACCPNPQALTIALSASLGPLVPLLNALKPIVSFITLFLGLPGIVTNPLALVDFVKKVTAFTKDELPGLLNLVPLPANPLPWIKFVRDTLNTVSTIMRCAAESSKLQVQTSLDIMKMEESADPNLQVVAECAKRQQEILVANQQFQMASINDLLALVTTAFDLALAAAPPIKAALKDAGVYPLGLSPSELADPDAVIAKCDAIDAIVANYLTPITGEL